MIAVCRLFLVVFVLYYHSLCCYSFQPASSSPRRSTNNNNNGGPVASGYVARDRIKPRDYSNLPSVEDERLPIPSSFQHRMLASVKQEEMKRFRSNKSQNQQPLMKEVRTLEEFKTTLEENHPLLVVIYYSPFCLACRSVVPGVRSLAKHHPKAKFIQIPVTDDNASLHQGLGIPSVPYLQLYLPDVQLAEEMKLNRRMISSFHKELQDYEMGSCSLARLGEWSTVCPYYSSSTTISSTSSPSTPSSSSFSNFPTKNRNQYYGP
jgi:thiol-disulfide isomerase/thioredoxin